MSGAFSRSLRSIEADRPRRFAWAIAAIFAVLGLWIAWFALAEVTVHQTSPARLEVAGEGHVIETIEGGRVIAVHLKLGRVVERGAVILELDSAAERHRLTEARALLASLERQLGAIRREQEAMTRALVDDRRALESAVDAVRAREDEASQRSRLAEEEARRAGQLASAGAAPELELVRRRAEASTRRAAVRALGADRRHLGEEQRTRDSTGRARVERLARSAAELEGRIAESVAAVRLLEDAIERRLVRAPIDGELGDVAAVQVGNVVGAGERLGVVVPCGGLRVIALYPVASLGRIHPGQRARVSLDGFSWLRFGHVAAQVATVGTEAHDGVVRVELVVDGAAPEITLQHGMTGTVEIALERATPAALVAHAIGRRLL